MKFQLLASALLVSAAAVQALPSDPSRAIFNHEPPSDEEKGRWRECTEVLLKGFGKSATGTSEACVFVDCLGQVANEYNRGGVLGIAAPVLGTCSIVNRVRERMALELRENVQSRS